MTLSPLTTETAQQLRVLSDTEGVLVTDVEQAARRFAPASHAAM